MPSDPFPPGGGGPPAGPEDGTRREPGFFSRQEEGPFLGRDQGFFHRSGIRAADKVDRSSVIRVLAVVVSLGVFGFIVWYAYQQGHKAGSDSVPPIIKADVNPVRVRPESPGGMEVPHQDKLVYDRVDPDARQPQVERLLPPPEAPLSRPSRRQDGGFPGERYPEPSFPETGKYSDIPVPTIPEEAPPQFVPAPAPLPQETPQPPVTAAPLPQPAPGTLPQPLALAPRAATQPPIAAAPPPQPAPGTLPQPLAPAPQAATKPPVTAAPPPPQAAAAQPPAAAPQKAPPAASAGAGAYRIQLAAMRTEDSAHKGWARLQKANKDLLGNLNLTIQRVDLGAKGTFFRVQAGPLKSEAAARALCREMAKRKSGCLVVRP